MHLPDRVGVLPGLGMHVHTMPLFDPPSLQAQAMRDDWMIFVAVAIVVAVVVYGLIAAALILWRERDGREPARFSGHTTLEIVTAVIPLLVVVGLFGVTFTRERFVDRVDARPNARIDVTAYRWSWRFDYPHAGMRVQGTPAQPPTLYLPSGRTTEIDLRSDDVTHSFWVPALLFKRDAIPGMTNAFDVTPTRVGTFEGRCAQFCGLEHARMTFAVRVVPADAFDRFVASGGKARP